MKTLTNVMESVTPLYESILTNTSDKVKSAGHDIRFGTELDKLKNIKWKRTGKSGSNTTYEFEWEAPHTLGVAFDGYKYGPVKAIVFHLTIGKGAGVVFNQGNTKDYTFWMELVHESGRSCGRCDFYTSSTIGVRGCQEWVNRFISLVFDSVENITKMREYIWKNDRDPDRLFSTQVIKAVTGKNHWQL